MDHPLTEQRAVRQWIASYQEFWRSDPPPSSWLDTLGQFAERYGTTPDEMVDEVLRPQPRGEGLTLRTRARRKYMQLIDEFEEAEGSRESGNAVRSFFIHNGIAMSPGILT